MCFPERLRITPFLSTRQPQPPFHAPYALTREKLTALKETLLRFPGNCAVSVDLSSEEKWSVTLGATGLKVEPSDALLSQLERLFGEKVAELR